MENKINELIKAYKLDANGMFTTEGLNKYHTKLEVSISLGSNEGYYVSITEGFTTYHLRFHSRDEALKTLGTMLTLIPDNY